MKRIFLAACAALLLMACTDRKLVPVEDDTFVTYDDLVEIRADFCIRESTEVDFPVKLLLVLDGSGSLQFTDQSGVRRAAVRDLMSALARQPDVYVSTMVFGSNVYVDPQISPGTPMFIPASDWVEPPFLGVADVQTNYHGAISAVRSHLLSDMLDSDPAELARTKYVVVFFSDGAPTPVCCLSAEESIGVRGELPFGCAPEPYETDVAGTVYCEGQEEQTLCNDETWLDNFRDLNGTTYAPDYGGEDGPVVALDELEPNDNYNRTYQIEDLVRETVELTETFGVGEFRLHTALLFDENLDPAIKEIYRLNRCRSEGLLRRMAELGGGVFRDFERSEEIDFLSFNFTSLQQGFSLLSHTVVNTNAMPAPDGFTPDTDGDGLRDSEEIEFGSGVNSRDSDTLATQPTPGTLPNVLPRDQWGDGYNDKIEMTYLTTGFDPRYQSLPVTPCPAFDPNGGADQSDQDVDGLTGCEEALLGTDREISDTDGDGIIDGLEVRFGLDPTVVDRNLDSDFDGIENLKELRRGSDPTVADADEREGLSFRYELVERDPTEDGRPCFTSVVKGVRLVTTEPRIDNGRPGYNDIYFWIAETPTDNPTGRSLQRFACYRAQYIAPSFKAPPTGIIEFTEEDLWDLANDEHLARLASGEDPCIGADLQ